jgi:hypothetical protein
MFIIIYIKLLFRIAMGFSCVIRILTSRPTGVLRHAIWETVLVGYSKRKENNETKRQAVSCAANVWYTCRLISMNVCEFILYFPVFCNYEYIRYSLFHIFI